MSYKDQRTLSMIINVLRSHLIKQGFFEHHLYSTLNYKIENTDTFKVGKGLYLRYNPEPDIWQVGEQYDKFFWVGSMFRNEKKVSTLHRYEFTVLDVYLKRGNMKMVVEEFLELLGVLEKSLHVEPLSKLPVKYVSYSELRKWKMEGSFWMVLTGYPIKESFYDTEGVNKHASNKFEIFYVRKGRLLEIAACGELGENLNPINYIKVAKKFLNKKVADKKFIGFGFGLERIAHIYGLL
jgi:lysyl-tRNA synthetase class II